MRGLDAFGDHFKIQVMGERDDGAHNVHVARFAIHAHDERAVDL